MIDRKIRSLRTPTNLLALAFLIFAAGCTATKISAINNDPAKYMAKDVTIAGQVINSFAIANQGAFEVDDETGRPGVWGSGIGVLGQGARFLGTGLVQSGVSVGGRFFAN